MLSPKQILAGAPNSQEIKLVEDYLKGNYKGETVKYFGNLSPETATYMEAFGWFVEFEDGCVRITDAEKVKKNQYVSLNDIKVIDPYIDIRYVEDIQFEATFAKESKLEEPSEVSNNQVVTEDLSVNNNSEETVISNNVEETA